MNLAGKPVLGWGPFDEQTGNIGYTEQWQSSLTLILLIWIDLLHDKCVVLKRTFGLSSSQVELYLELVYLVTALVPSDTACLASSPGSSRRTAVWISLEVMVDLLL